MFLYNGDDTRNYYRATGGDVRLSRTWESAHERSHVPYVGARYERASSVRPGFDATRRTMDTLRPVRRRPRRPPPTEPAHRRRRDLRPRSPGRSGIGTPRLRLAARVHADGEAASRFAQITAGGFISFPTFGSQSLHADAHVVGSAGGQYASAALRLHRRTGIGVYTRSFSPRAETSSSTSMPATTFRSTSLGSCLSLAHLWSPCEKRWAGRASAPSRRSISPRASV